MLTIPKTTLTVKPNHSGITKIIPRDEDSSKVVINKMDYDKKVEEMIKKE